MGGTAEVPSSERFETIIIGGGQAGLSMGHQLAKRGRPFVILDAQGRIGDAWRTRWDSLRLFTPARYDGLEGMRFPGPSLAFPTKDEMADYLEAYAQRFDLPVRTGVRVVRLARAGDEYVVTAVMAACGRNTSSWQRERIGRRRCRPSTRSSIRRSCRCIRRTTRGPPNWMRVVFSWWGWATRAPRSPSKSCVPIARGSLAVPPASSLFVTDGLRRVSCFPWSASWATMS